ncbi:hypothetical protein SO802_020525 [Lithocarpus litseifolius]|uniref:Uncharacterized protein n=1 Tax=Lithocarpus litseifolius TaxID=425828 RepID=A0AAW2CG92_9ROSI
MFERKINPKAEGLLVCVCASDEALGFFEAFHELLAYLVSFLAALIGLHFQVLGVSPLETHFAIILLLIMATIIYSIAYVEIKLLPRNADLPLFRFICLVSGIIAIELLVAIIISPFWLFMVNVCPILIVGGCEKRKLKHLITDWMKSNPGKLNFINLDRYPICRVAVKPRNSDSSLSLDRC